jgi:hypothetical protein
MESFSDAVICMHGLPLLQQLQLLLGRIGLSRSWQGFVIAQGQALMRSEGG